MREIEARQITDAVRELFKEANCKLPCDMKEAICRAQTAETKPIAKEVLGDLLANLDAAKEMNIPICQDTGMAVVFVDLGSEVLITGGTLQEAVDAGVSRAYLEGKLRCSVVTDPLYDRTNTGDNTPAILHIRSVKGDKLTITAAPKGFGSENMSALKMLTPSATEDDVADFVVESVKRAGSNPCPPITVGVGIGSDFEGVALLAKRALIRPCGSHNSNPRYGALEEKILSRINGLAIGPQGFGGDTTAFAVHIEFAPTHIAGLPCAVNIGCHVNRHTTVEL